MCRTINIFNTTFTMNYISSSSDNESLFNMWGDEIPDESLSSINEAFQNINIKDTELQTQRSILNPFADFLSAPIITESPSIDQTTQLRGAESLEIVGKPIFNRYLMTDYDTDLNNIPSMGFSSLILSDSEMNNTPFQPITGGDAISHDTITKNISSATSKTGDPLNKGGARPKSRKSIPVSPGSGYFITNFQEGDQLKDQIVLKRNQSVKKTNRRQRTQGCGNTNSSVLQSHVEKIKSELEYEVDNVNQKLEDMYHDLKNVYRVLLEVSQTMDTIVEGMDKILENISLQASKINKRFSHDAIARSETLNPLIDELNTNHAFINEVLKSNKIQKESLSKINEDIRAVELRGGEITKKKKIITLLLVLFDKFQKIYEEQAEKINAVKPLFDYD